MGLGGIGMILFWVLLIVLVVWLAGWGARSWRGRGGPTGSDALGILKRRYARGEIDRDEFEEKKRALRS